MFEKVNPSHVDKMADRIAGAIVDLAYKIQKNPKIAVEVMLGHGQCHIITESTVKFHFKEIQKIVFRITESENIRIFLKQNRQDIHLNRNQKDGFRCGDNGIFRGVPVTEEQKKLVSIAKDLYSKYPFDGKYILDGERLIICQSNASSQAIRKDYLGAEVNPIGEWTGGPNTDVGCCNRKLGSDMGDAVTGGGLHGKDLSKADVSVNIYAHFLAQKTGKPVEFSCAIGDETIDGKPYSKIVEIARFYIEKVGGFEKFAEWGLV